MSMFQGMIDEAVPVYRKDGFDRVFTNHNVNVIQTEYRTEDTLYDNTLSELGKDEKMKQHLVNNLIKELYNSNSIEFVKMKVTQKFEDINIAKIHVVDKKFKNVMMQESSYYLDDIEFKEDEIKEAIKNTYPERFI